MDPEGAKAEYEKVLLAASEGLSWNATGAPPMPVTDEDEAQGRGEDDTMPPMPLASSALLPQAPSAAAAEAAAAAAAEAEVQEAVFAQMHIPRTLEEFSLRDAERDINAVATGRERSFHYATGAKLMGLDADLGVGTAALGSEAPVATATAEGGTREQGGEDGEDDDDEEEEDDEEDDENEGEGSDCLGWPV